MRITLFFSFLLSSICSIHCQLESSWNISASLGVSQRQSKLNLDYEITNDFNPETFINYWNNIEKPGLSYMLEVRNLKALNKRYGLITGVQISALTRKVKIEATSNLDDPRLGVDGSVTFGDYDFLKVKQRDFFVSLPIGIHYNLSNIDSWYVEGTLNPLIYLSSSSKTIFERIDSHNNESKRLDRKNAFTNLNLAPELQVGRNFPINQKVALNIALSGQWTVFSGYQKDSPYIQRRYFIGVKLGININK